MCWPRYSNRSCPAVHISAPGSGMASRQRVLWIMIIVHNCWYKFCCHFMCLMQLQVLLWTELLWLHEDNSWTRLLLWTASLLRGLRNATYFCKWPTLWPMTYVWLDTPDDVFRHAWLIHILHKLPPYDVSADEVDQQQQTLIFISQICNIWSCSYLALGNCCRQC